MMKKEVKMFKGFKGSVLILMMVLIAFSVVACGGGTSSSSVTYDGSSDPAVADSTNASTLAEFGMGAVQAGFPLAEPFVMGPPGMVVVALEARPQAMAFETTITIPVPADAVIQGSEYDSTYGTGTADLNGTLTIYLGSDDAEAATWYILEGVLNGNIVFDDFSPEGEPTISGKVTVPYGKFYFYEEGVGINLNTSEWTGDPGPPVWLEVEMTFSNLTVTDSDGSWYLGEGDWYLENVPNVTASLDINSLTVEYDGNTYKLEDTNVFVDIGEGSNEISIAGTGLIENGTFYHPDLGVIYFSGGLIDAGDGGIVDGLLEFYDAAVEGTLIFTVEFEWDDSEGATAYWIYFEDGSYDEFGYYDGSFTPDPGAMVNFTL